MKIQRFLTAAKIVLVGHVFNWLWRDRKHRRRVRTEVTARVLPEYFKRYLHVLSSIKPAPIIKDDKNEKIFSIWLQGEENAPPIVKATFRSIRHNCKQELLVLDEKSLFDYIQLPDYIMEKRRKKQIKNAHFADICRIELLYRHGGFWMDATDFTSQPIPQEIVDQDFFVYMTGMSGSPYSFMQNCFIRSRRGAYLLAAWRAVVHEFWKHENHEFDYFMHQLIFKTIVLNDPLAIAEFAKMLKIEQKHTHALWWKYKNKPFDQKIFDEITSNAFFQKISFKGQDNPTPGTFAAEMIKMYPKD